MHMQGRGEKERERDTDGGDKQDHAPGPGPSKAQGPAFCARHSQEMASPRTATALLLTGGTLCRFTSLDCVH
jgi:hypothetical protein